MSLSKPIFHLLGTYLQNLYLNPIRTKSITSGLLAALANYSSQCFTAERHTNYNSILAFGAFGFLFGGSLPHFFYAFLDRCFPNNGGSYGLFRQLLFERLIYTPLFQAFFLYTTSIFEGKSHKDALRNLENLLEKVVKLNWKYLTIFQFINLAFVPPMFRVLFVNIVGFIWSMSLAYYQREETKKDEARKKARLAKRQ